MREQSVNIRTLKTARARGDTCGALINQQRQRSAQLNNMPQRAAVRERRR